MATAFPTQDEHASNGEGGGGDIGATSPSQMCPPGPAQAALDDEDSATRRAKDGASSTWVARMDKFGGRRRVYPRWVCRRASGYGSLNSYEAGCRAVRVDGAIPRLPG